MRFMIVGRVQFFMDSSFKGEVGNELEFVVEIFEIVLWRVLWGFWWRWWRWLVR